MIEAPGTDLTTRQSAAALDTAAVLAAHLLRRALPVLAAHVVPSTVEARAAVLDAIDTFLATPCASRHLAAVRALGTLRRAASLSRLSTKGAERAFRSGLDEVHAALGPEVADELAVLGEASNLDRRAGARLSALAALATTRGELAGRIAAEAAALRTRMAFRPTPPPAEGRLAFEGRRKAARAARRVSKRPRR